MFLLKHKEVEIKFYVNIIQVAFFFFLRVQKTVSLQWYTMECLCLHTVCQETPPATLEKLPS